MPSRGQVTRRRGRHRRAVVSGVTVGLVIAVGTTAWAMTTSTGGSYRTTRVDVGDVTASLDTTGTVSQLRSADVDFQVAGTVKKVLVHQGAHVRAGERLATLDRSTLAADVASDRSSLRSAESALSSAESGTSSSTGTTTSTTAAAAATSDRTATTDASSASATSTAHDMARASTSASPTASPTATSTSGSSSTGGVAADEAAVVAAQHTTDVDLSTATTALAAAKSACATAGSPACVSTSASLLADQTTVAADEKAVQAAEGVLTAALEAQTNSGTGGTTASASPRPSASATSGSATSGSQSGSSGSTRTTVTASTLATDEASIDAAKATLATALGNLAAATLTSPITGTVTAVTISAGDTASGSSSSTSPAYVVTGHGHTAVTVDLTASQVRTVTVGMSATAIPDGTTTAVTGRVVTIGAMDTDSDYPVVVELDRTPAGTVSGSDAAVTLSLATAHGVVRVATSAVHRSGTTTYINQLVGDKEVRRTVVVGAVGSDYTQVTSGLQAGETVVLASLHASLPSSSSDQVTTRSGSSGSGGMTGGGQPGGGTGTFGPGGGQSGSGGPGGAG